MGNVTAKTSGDIASFMTPAETNIKSLKVHFSPKQLGEGDPSPENVREIEGWDGVEAFGSGRNLINESFLSNADNYSNAGSYGYKYTDYIQLVPNTKYCFTWFDVDDSNMKECHLYVGGASEYIINNGLHKQYPNGFTTNDTGQIRFGINKGSYSTNQEALNDIFNHGKLLLQIGTEAASYEPYQGNNISYQWKLPDEYQEVEWIKSDGNQFIQLPFGFDDTDEIETVFSIEQPAIDKYINSPSVWNNNGNRFGMGKYKGDLGQTFTAAYGTRMTGYTYLEPPTNPDYDLHKWTYKNHVFAIPELEISRDVSNIKFGGTTANLKLFFGYNANTIGKISYYKHIKSDASYHLVACYRKSDGEIGLYDIVNNVFYTNQGTGTFSKGEDVFCDTAYGGYIDLISGELVEEWGMFTVDEPDTTWKVNHPARIIVNFPRKYIFSSRTMPRKSMCTIIPERSSADFNYGYLDNVSSIEHDHVLFLNYTGNGEGWAELFGEEATNENVKPHLQELGFAICATLAEPITHQLTPTQLSSFIGQNNFWSNADYVEIEYELKETEDIQKCRKKIILNQPQLKTISDKVVSFNTDMVAPLKNCKIYFKPIQLRTGDPSPTNVRNINGWTELDSYVNGNKVSVDWTNDIGTIYGGYLDLAKKEVVAEWEIAQGKWGDIKSSTPNSITGYYYGRLNYNNAIQVCHSQSNYFVDSICNITNTILWNTGEKTPEHYYSGNDSNGKGIVYIYGNFNDNVIIQVASRLLEPIHYPLSSLTPQQLLTLKSTNHIWSETNGQQIDVKYWTHKNLIPTPLTNYLENQTWIDSAYISSSGKKTTNTVSASHFLTNQILLEAGTYVLSGFSYYVGTDSTRYRIHAYDSTGKWLRQITFQQIDNLSPVDISFTLDTDTYVNVSIAMDFDGVLAKIS